MGSGTANGEGEEISILSPEEVSRLLEVACDETRPLYALAAFAGVRWAEIELEWSDIRENEIVIKAAKAKTRSRRVVEILPNLRKFLAPYRAGPALSFLSQRSNRQKESRAPSG